MTAVPHGVTPGVWVNDNLNRLQRVLREFDHVELTLADIERLERLLAQAHADNLIRLRRYADLEAAAEAGL